MHFDVEQAVQIHNTSWVLLMLKDEKMWYIICPLVSSGRLFLKLSFLKNIDLSLKVSRNNLHDAFDGLIIKSLDRSVDFVEHES